MDVFKLYDQFTTNWERLRAQLISHLIAAALLWLVGFELALPQLALTNLNRLPSDPTFQLLQNLGFLAFVSFLVVLTVAVYAILLNELGKLLLIILAVLAPPSPPIEVTRKFAPFEVLITIAATLEGGTYKGPELGSQFFELLRYYSAQKPDEFKAALAQQPPLQRDATTHLRNALAFCFLWCAVPFIFDGTPLAVAIEQVFWQGLAILLVLVLLARARYRFAICVTVASLYGLLSGFIHRDPTYAGKLAFARANQEPYRRLVRAFLNDEPDYKKRPWSFRLARASLNLRLRISASLKAALISFGLRDP